MITQNKTNLIKEQQSSKFASTNSKLYQSSSEIVYPLLIVWKFVTFIAILNVWKTSKDICNNFSSKIFTIIFKHISSN